MKIVDAHMVGALLVVGNDLFSHGGGTDGGGGQLGMGGPVVVFRLPSPLSPQSAPSCSMIMAKVSHCHIVSIHLSVKSIK